MSYQRKILGGKNLRNFILIFLILALLFSSFVSGKEYEPSEKNPLWKEFMEGAIDPIIYFVGSLANRVLLIYSSFTPQIKETGELTYGDLEKYLLSNPQPIREVSDLISYFISILQPLYVAAIILLGIYLIFFSGSPLGRAKAKSYLLRLILSLILISITPAIIKLLFSLSEGLTQTILSLGPINFLKLHQDSIFYSLSIIKKTGVANVLSSLPFILFSFLITTGVFLILILRYLLVLLLAVLFPPAIFLFSFKPTRNIGKILLSQLFFWIFLPVSFAVALVAIAIGENLFHHVLAELWCFFLGGTLALILSPVGMFYTTKGAMKVLEKLSKKFSEMEKKIIPELEGIEERKIPEKEVEIQLKEISKEGKINHQELKQRKKFYQQLQKEAQDREESVAELLREKYNFKLIQEKEAWGTKRKEEKHLKERLITTISQPRIKTKIPTPFQKLEKREKGIVVKLGLGVKPTSASLEVENGAAKGVEVKIDNLTGSVLNEIALIDQGLVENNILVSYSTNNFSLKSGESKTILVKVNVMEGTEARTYEGTILVTCKEGFKNFIEVKVKVLPEGAQSDLTSKIKAPLVNLTNLEGEISYEELEENVQLFKKLSQAAEAQGKTLEEFVKDEYNLRVVHEKAKGDLCTELSELANVDKEISLAQLKEKKELYGEISKLAEEEGKSIPEYVKEKCGFVVMGERIEEQRPLEGEKMHRISTYTPKEIEEERKVVEEKEPEEELAPLAPEAPPKIIFPP